MTSRDDPPTGDVPVNGPEDHPLVPQAGMVQTLNTLVRIAGFDRRLAALEEWRKLVDHSPGHLTGLEPRLKALEKWKESEGRESEGKKQRKRDWIRDLVLLVAGAALALFGAWLSSQWGTPPPTP